MKNNKTLKANKKKGGKFGAHIVIVTCMTQVKSLKEIHVDGEV